MPDLSPAPTLARLVPSLDTCRALKDAGWVHPTAFAWFTDCDDAGEPDDPDRPPVVLTDRRHRDWCRSCAAPTFSEVWDRLPVFITTDAHGDGYTSDYHRSLWTGADGREIASYLSVDHDDAEVLSLFPADAEGIIRQRDAEEEHERPVEAAAALYIALVQAGHIQATP